MKAIVLSSGIKLTCVRVSPLLVMDLFRNFPEPTPPLVKVVIDGKEVEEENPAHPDYDKAVLQHRVDMERRLRSLYIAQGVRYKLSDDELAQVKALREFWQTEYSRQLPGNDLFVFISYIAIENNDDYSLITEEVGAQTQATPKSSDSGDTPVPSEV